MNYKTIDEFLGKAIKTAREAQGISLTGFAQQFNISKQLMFQYENAQVSIPEEIFFRSCEILKLNPQKILKEATKQFVNEKKGLD